MSHLIQELEPRRLLTASAASLGAELANINIAGTTIKADLKALSAGAKADLKTLGKALKGTASTNAALLKHVQADETKQITRMSADVTVLLKSSATAKACANDGDKSIASPANVALSNKISVDVNVLAGVAVNPQTKLITDSATGIVDNDFATLATANPTLAATFNADRAHFDSLVAKVLTDASAYAKTISVLKTDLATLQPVLTTKPSLIGDYQGTFKTKAIAFGLGSVTVPFEIKITAQTLNTVTGTITAEGNSASGTIVATEYSNGKLTLKISSTSLTVNLAGIVNVNNTKTGLPPGSAITGTGTVSVLGFDISGSFQVIKVA